VRGSLVADTKAPVLSHLELDLIADPRIRRLGATVGSIDHEITAQQRPGAPIVEPNYARPCARIDGLAADNRRRCFIELSTRVAGHSAATDKRDEARNAYRQSMVHAATAQAMKSIHPDLQTLGPGGKQLSMHPQNSAG
jgi:hypothetical protein